MKEAIRNIVLATGIAFSITSMAGDGGITIPGVQVYNQNGSDRLFFARLTNVLNEPVDVKVSYYDNNNNLVTDGDNNAGTGLATARFVTNYSEMTTGTSMSFTLPANGSGQFGFRGSNASIDTIGYIRLTWSSQGSTTAALMGNALGQLRLDNGTFADTMYPLAGGNPF